MKIQVKETLARRLTVVVLTLAAIVGVCAFTFSGTQNYAWAEGEEPIATWTSVPEPGDGGAKADGKNLTLEIKQASSSDHLEAHFTNNDGDTIPPSVLKLTTEDGSVLTAYFGEDISPTNQAASSIEGSKADTRFTKAELYLMPETVTVTFDMKGHGTQIDPIKVKKGTSVTLPQPTDPNYDFGGWFTEESLTTSFNGIAATSMTVYAQWTEKEKVTVSFESEFGTTPEAKTVNKGEIVELPNLGTDGDYTFVGWIMKGSEGTDPFIGEYTAKENITFTAVWEAPSTPTNSTIPQTGDNQMALLASLCFSAAALSAVGIALTAYRKRKHV